MVANVWFDRERGGLRYNIEDSRYPILGSGEFIDRKTEIDPTQKMSRSDGRSPAAIITSTFSDELALFYGGQSKIFGVSVKDRGAVSMAGHAGKAFWFSKVTGEFVTSSFYYDSYPEWVNEWNGKRLVDGWHEKSWELMNDPETYLFGDRDDRAYEIDLAGFGRTFPHPYGDKTGKYYTTLLTISPAGDDLTLDFAKTAIEREELGADAVPDYLSISFSATDYVGHMFGPSSLEAEENILRLDRTLADLFAFVDEKVGLENTLIVLSADHGAPEAPGYLNELGFQAGYVDPGSWDKAPAITALRNRFGLGEELIETYFHPYLYLNRDAIAERGLDLAEVANAVAEQLVKFDGVSLAIASERLSLGLVPEAPAIRAIINNFNPLRSGDIYVVFEPHSFINNMDGLTVTSTHGSPWTYDTFVPIFFAGAGVTAQRIVRPTQTIDVAPNDILSGLGRNEKNRMIASATIVTLYPESTTM